MLPFRYHYAVVAIILIAIQITSEKTVRTPLLAYDTGTYKIQDLSKYLQPNDLLSGKYDFSKPTEHQCARDCDLYPKPRLCYYKFVLEQYHAMGPACDGCPEDIRNCSNTQCVPADGIEKTILTMNRQLCAPAIVVCHHDRIVVDVVNKMPGKTVAIHWHGQHQEGYPFMDGIPYITQCPIVPDQTFRYNFPAATPGDFFHHSHEFLQILDGLQGPLIVRTSRRSDRHSNEYDEDLYSHIMFIQDWMHHLSDEKFPGYNNMTSMIGLVGDSILINGHGSYVNADRKSTKTPLTVFNVQKGKRYRFRIISGVVFPVPAVLTIEDHDFQLISLDGSPIRTVEGGSLMIFGGERYSIIISANKEPRSYWIQVRNTFLTTAVTQYAILQYVNEDGSDTNIPLVPVTKRPLKTTLPIINDVTKGCKAFDNSALCADEFQSLYPAPSGLLQKEPDYRLFITSGFHVFTRQELYLKDVYQAYYLPFGGVSLGGMISDIYNNISLVMPSFSLLTQDNPVPENLVCTKDCFKSFCECLQIYKIPLGAVVELVITDASFGASGVTFDHPQHLHGYYMRVLKQGGPEEMKNNKNFYKNLIPTDYRLFPVRDTVVVPYQGFAVVRFWATNPGIWLMHCHVIPHAITGMEIVLQIGEREGFPNPPKGFPRCGDFAPDVDIFEALMLQGIEGFN